jgi:hypothetical protein
MFHRITGDSVVQNDLEKISRAPAKFKAVLNLMLIWCMGVWKPDRSLLEQAAEGPVS